MEDILTNQNSLLLVKPSDIQEMAINIARQFLSSQTQTAPNKPEAEKPFSQSEAIIFLGKSRQTLVKWRKKGYINAYRLGGRIYYKPSELISALQKLG